MTNKDFRIGQIVTLTPQSVTLFEVIEIDDIDGELIRVMPVGGNRDPFWYGTKYAKATNAMDRPQLVKWLKMHGAEDDQMDEFLDDYLGKTEAEMDKIHEECHGSMA